MATQTSCPYCGEPYLNFGDDDEGVEMWIDRLESGGYIIAADPPTIDGLLADDVIQFTKDALIKKWNSRSDNA